LVDRCFFYGSGGTYQSRSGSQDLRALSNLKIKELPLIAVMRGSSFFAL
jgi:hypothetical protein